MAVPSGLALQPDERRLTLPHFVADVCARHRSRAALRDDRGAWTFDDLEREVGRVARGLVGAGVGKGTRVGVLMANRREWVSATFGASLAGAVVVPLNTFGTADELDYVLGHADVAVLLMQTRLLKHRYLADLLDRHPEVGRGEPGAIRCRALPHLRRVIAFDDQAPVDAVESWSALETMGATVDSALLEGHREAIDPSDDALIIYTSGTTAKPKGVIHRHRAPVIQSWRFAEYMLLEPTDRVWTAQPFFWTAGICMSLGASLAAGAELVLQDRFEPGAALERIEQVRPTTLHAWPHQEKAMAEHPSAAKRDLSSVHRIEFTSALAPIVGLERDEWGTYGSYGLSETFTICTALPASAPAEDRARTSGVPLPGMDVRIVDPETGEELPRGERGEIAVRGLTLMRGYAKVAPELVFDREGFFRTQDGGYVDEQGSLHWKGRLSNLIKTGGANVSPLEIESLLERTPGLTAVVAVGVPHPTLGEALVLCAIRSPDGVAPSEEELLETLRGRLAAYKLPRRVLFFEETDVAKTANHKIQAGAMREAAEARLRAEDAEIAGHHYTAPERGRS
jgi:acyl-CoA synthetase (AMP-forming)/AMP-acid ligase II